MTRSAEGQMVYDQYMALWHANDWPAIIELAVTHGYTPDDEANPGQVADGACAYLARVW